jgi:hypothetical protein
MATTSLWSGDRARILITSSQGMAFIDWRTRNDLDIEESDCDIRSKGTVLEMYRGDVRVNESIVEAEILRKAV